MDGNLIVKVFLDPATYPHDCGDIQLMETHISWVFLTGRYAYKVKKPVDFGFLDFSTLDKRRFYCDQELARNQVFAGDIYRQVFSIIEEGGVYKLSENLDNAKEYAVQMKQFLQADLLPEKISNGSFNVENAHAMGADIARLHQSIEIADSRSKWGTKDAVRYPIQENFDQIQPLLFDDADLHCLNDITAWSFEQLEQHLSLFEERKSNGFIKACHGDLHLNNILWCDDKTIPFDCIEFNDEFRWIDVVSELAFLLMDLEHRGNGDLASHCLNGYLEVSGDFNSLALLDFYKVYRAMVRAKVAVLRRQQPALSEEEKHSLYEEYQSYVALAQRTIKRTKPCLYITHGVSGSGKTTMARYVAGKINAIHIRSDVERKRLFGLAAADKSESTLDAGIYTKDATVKTFQALESITQSLISVGHSVIVDATFLRKSSRDQFSLLATTLNIPFAILDCSIDEETARKRIKSRMVSGQDASEADLKVLENQLCDQDFLSPDEQRHVVVIDMGKPLDDIEIESLIRGEHIGD